MRAFTSQLHLKSEKKNILWIGCNFIDLLRILTLQLEKYSKVNAINFPEYEEELEVFIVIALLLNCFVIQLIVL